MSIFRNRFIINALKLYVCGVLIVTAIFSGPVTAVVCVLVLLAYLILQWRSKNVFIALMVNYFIFFAIGLLVVPVTNFLVAALVSLPMLFLITHSLTRISGFAPISKSQYSHRFSPLGIILPLIAVVTLIIALFLGAAILIFSGSIAIVYLAVLVCLSLTQIPADSVAVDRIQVRILAGTATELHISLHPKTAFGGTLFIESPYSWLKVHSPVLTLQHDPVNLNLTLMPLLSGPSVVSLNAYAFDVWGLTQFQFQIVPVQLYVIPRARYAAWLARRYLAATKPGMLPMIANISTAKPQYGFRRGIEYYGSQLYQPGDELKSVDWKHSAKYNKMITKEFIEFHGQPVVLLVNLAVTDAEAADELAQKTIVAALSLAREQIPAVLAAYDRNVVKLVTPFLQPRQLVVQSLEITKEITVFENPARYLNKPDIVRLRANIRRLALVGGDSAKALSQLLGIESANVIRDAIANPATQTIEKAVNNSNLQSTFIVVSGLNHDANAIEFNRLLLTKKGYALVIV
jgi:Protein of unknown function DUF58